MDGDLVLRALRDKGFKRRHFPVLVVVAAMSCLVCSFIFPVLRSVFLSIVNVHVSRIVLALKAITNFALYH